jgi:hypothetical protein
LPEGAESPRFSAGYLRARSGSWPDESDADEGNEDVVTKNETPRMTE